MTNDVERLAGIDAAERIEAAEVDDADLLSVEAPRLQKLELHREFDVGPHDEVFDLSQVRMHQQNHFLRSSLRAGPSLGFRGQQLCPVRPLASSGVMVPLFSVSDTATF